MFWIGLWWVGWLVLPLFANVHGGEGNFTFSAWGKFPVNRANIPAGLTNVTAISGAADTFLVLRRDGTVVALTQNQPTTLPYTNIAQVAAGNASHLLLTKTGQLISTLDDVPAGLKDVVAIAAGAQKAYAVTSDGRITAWGDGGCWQGNLPSGATNIVSIAGGECLTAALRRDGKVIC